MFFWNSLAFSVIQRMLAIWSLVPLPFLKPAPCLNYCLNQWFGAQGYQAKEAEWSLFPINHKWETGKGFGPRRVPRVLLCFTRSPYCALLYETPLNKYVCVYWWDNISDISQLYKDSWEKVLTSESELFISWAIIRWFWHYKQCESPTYKVSFLLLARRNLKSSLWHSSSKYAWLHCVIFVSWLISSSTLLSWLICLYLLFRILISSFTSFWRKKKGWV